MLAVPFNGLLDADKCLIWRSLFIRGPVAVCFLWSREVLRAEAKGDIHGDPSSLRFPFHLGFIGIFWGKPAASICAGPSPQDSSFE